MKTNPLAFLLCASFFSCAWAQTPTKAVKAGAISAKLSSKQPAPDAPASSEDLGIAQRVHLGAMPCELGATVHLSSDPAAPGYFHVTGKGFRYRMKPVATTTGAIRLEDPKAGAVWLQLANKSMLMDQKNGRRVADECAHPDQVAFAKDMVNNPPPALIDTTGMGR